MRMTAMKVDLHLQFANRPSVVIKVDEVPSREELRYVPYFSNGCTLYVAECRGAVDFMFHDPGNQEGYGGREFHITLVNGSNVMVKGPWSSRPGVVNQMVPGLRVMDVMITTGNGAEVSYHQATVDWIRSQDLRVAQFNRSGETTFEILDGNGDFFKPLNERDQATLIGEVE